MSEPRRLKESSGDSVIGRLLATAEADGLGEEELQRVLGRLGIAGTSAPRAPSADESLEAGEPLRTSAIRVVAARRRRWAGAGVVVLLGCTGMAAAAALPLLEMGGRTFMGETAQESGKGLECAQSTLRALGQRSEARARSLARSETGVAPGRATGNSPVAAPRSRPRPEPTSVSLAREVRLLDGARARLRQGDARGALSALDDHRRQFPASRLQTEAHILLIEAHALGGDKNWAASASQQFLIAHPNSPYAKRLRALHGVTGSGQAAP